MSLLDEAKGIGDRYADRELKMARVLRKIAAQEGQEAADYIRRLALDQDISRNALVDLLDRHGYTVSLSALRAWRRAQEAKGTPGAAPKKAPKKAKR